MALNIASLNINWKVVVIFSYLLAFLIAEFITRGIIYGPNSPNTGIYVLSSGQYIRVHHYELGLLLVIISLIVLAISYFKAWPSIFIVGLVVLGVGLGVTTSGILDILI